MTRLIVSLLFVAVGAPEAARAAKRDSARKQDERNAIVDFVAPGCLGSGSSFIESPGVFFEYFAEREGDVSSPGIGEGVLFDGNRWFFPRLDLNRHVATRALVLAPNSFERVVLHYDLPVYVGADELAFQYPIDVGRDWLEVLAPQASPRAAFATMQKKAMRLVLYRRKDGLRVLSLEPKELPEARPIDTDLLRYIPGRGLRLDIEGTKANSSVYALGRRIGRGSRIAGELRGLGVRSQDRLVVSAGSVVESYHSPGYQEYCANAMRFLGPDAIVPGQGELGLAPDVLLDIAQVHQLPYIAANLTLRSDGSRPFPRYAVRTIDDLVVAFIGAVTPAQLGGLPAPARKQWLLEPLRSSLDSVLTEIREEVGRRPDLTVLLTDGRALQGGREVRGVDVVLGEFSGQDRRRFFTVTELRERNVGISDGSRSELAVVSVQASRDSVGRLDARFKPRPGGGAWRLNDITLDHASVLEQGPRDERIERDLRKIEEEELVTSGEVVLADPAAAVKAEPDLEELVYGDRVVLLQRFTEASRAQPVVFTDALWMRLVTNIMLVELEAEVAISRSLPRRISTVGRIQRRYLDDWLRVSDAVRVVDLSGSDLEKIAERISAQSATPRLEPRSFLYAAGLDADAEVVRGRSLKTEQRYRVALTDEVIDLMRDIDFGDYEITERFTLNKQGAFANPQGKALLLRELVLNGVERDSAQTNPVQQRVYLNRALEDYSDVRDIKWTAQVEEGSVRGSRYQNNGSVGRLEDTRQTRLTTRNNYNFDLRTRLRGTYDGPVVTWDNRLRAELSQLVFDSDTAIDRQEPSDDLVLTSELRFNSVEVELYDSGVTISPFIQAAGDTEFTPTQDPDTGEDNRRQYLLRGLLGLVALPGDVLREVRLAAVFENDFVNDSTEYGLQTSYESRWLILPELTWESTLEARYFFPTDQDDETRLGLIVQAVNRFLVPVGGYFDIFAYVDLYVARGKVEATDSIGASWDFGAGIDIARLFIRSRASTVRESWIDQIIEVAQEEL